MRATFRGVHKCVINDNKNTVLNLVSEYNIIMKYISCESVPENMFSRKVSKQSK